jgi:hypothetical protein
MIEGAIIGAVIGLVVSMVMLLARKGTRKKLLQTLKAEGPEAARRLLDEKLPPLTKIPLGKILDQRERMVALAILGDLPALEQEIAAHRGTLTAVVQVDAIGLLGIALRSPDPSDAVARLDALATRMEKEGGATMALVKKKTRALAVLGKGLTGEPIPSQTRLVLESLTGDGGMVQLLIWQAIARSLEKGGAQLEQAQGLRRKVQEHTDAFES